MFATGETLTVRPTKIVSGHEADKTNELLQAIARAINTKVLCHTMNSSDLIISSVKCSLDSNNKKYYLLFALFL